MKKVLIYTLLLACTTLWAQEESSSYTMEEFREIKTDILFGYYEQDGHHSAVTGGEGTEQLNAAMPTIIVSIPFKNGHQVSINLGADAYSSASSDNININTTSGASSKDTRIHGVASYTKEFIEKGWVLGANGSFSNEYDYFSTGFGASALKMLNNENTQISLSTQVYLDNWALIYPYELRGQGALLDSDKRHSYSASLSFTQVINRRMQMAFFSDMVWQNGLLSTPYHRVYFHDYDNGNTAKIEYLPNKRFKLPIGLRFSYFTTDWLISRLYYRYYYDNFGVSGNTLQLMTPIIVNDKISISPIYRFYNQNASSYFAPKGAHSVSEQYYTSDYDLSDFYSHSVGLEFELSSAEGIVSYHLFGRKARWESMKTRYTYYQRSDGLKAHLISLGITLKN